MGKRLDKKIDEAQYAAADVLRKYNTVIDNQDDMQKILKDIETLNKQSSKKLAKMLADEIRDLSKAYTKNVETTCKALETMGSANETLGTKIGILRAHVLDREKRGKGDKQNTKDAQAIVAKCWETYKFIDKWKKGVIVKYK